MKKTTRRLAQQVQLALLTLPDTLLLETTDRWLKELDALFEDTSITDGYFAILGFRPRSKTSGQPYTSLDALYESEPEAEEISWRPPAAQELRETLRTMQPTQIYPTVIAMAGEVFRQKPFALHWREPPGSHSDGYAFMRHLICYLALRKAGGDISTEQFEALYSEQLEALAAPSELAGADPTADHPGLFPNERQCHFRVVFLHPPGQQRHNLQQALQRYDFTALQAQGENSIEGFVSYFPSHRDGLETLARIRRLLNRWQRDGQITWTERKEKPPGRRRAPKLRQRGKRK